MKYSTATTWFARICLLVMIQVSWGQVPQETTPADGEIASTILEVSAPNLTKNAQLGEELIDFSFALKNRSDQPLTIQQVQTSCGCTSASGITLPLTVAPQKTISLPVQMNIVGKTGQVTKTVFVVTDQGNKTLLVTTIIPAFPIESGTQLSRREANQQQASADRQAIFRDDCANCHVTPATGKMGRELYETACGICHEAQHRASMVPDLTANKERTAAYWRELISLGRNGTLMPAFAKSHDGILDEKQIDSLVDYLTKEYHQDRKKVP